MAKLTCWVCGAECASWGAESERWYRREHGAGHELEIYCPSCWRRWGAPLIDAPTVAVGGDGTPLPPAPPVPTNLEPPSVPYNRLDPRNVPEWVTMATACYRANRRLYGASEWISKEILREAGESGEIAYERDRNGVEWFAVESLEEWLTDREREDREAQPVLYGLLTAADVAVLDERRKLFSRTKA